MVATDITASSAELNGLVSSKRFPVTTYFEWGETASYGNRTADDLIERPGQSRRRAGEPVVVTITGLTAHTTYSFRIVAQNNNGTSYGADRSFTTIDEPPAPPTGVMARSGDSQVMMSWDPVPDSIGYALYLSATSPVTKTTGSVIPLVTSPFTVTGLTNGQPYFFVVTASNEVGESPESSQVSSTPNLCANRTGGAIITLQSFTGASESLTVWFTDEVSINKALSQLAAPGGALWAIVHLVDGADCDPQWSWHVDPTYLDFAELTIEACQSNFSGVEADKAYWLAFVQLCAAAKVISVDDRR
jgi:hypothetical protein